MSKNPRKILGLGRGVRKLAPDEMKVPSIEYVATAETLRRADEMGKYHNSPRTPEDLSLICSGGYPEVASKGAASRPPEGSSEAHFQLNRLVGVWGVPLGKIAIEDRSGSTFGNIIECIQQGLLEPGEFDPDNPLVVSASRRHSWRTWAIARQALVLPDDSMLRLRDGWNEMTPRHAAEERIGYALTRLALAEVSAEHGNLEHTRQASEWFNQHAQNPLHAF